MTQIPFQLIWLFYMIYGCTSSNDLTSYSQQDLKELYPSDTLIIDTHSEWTRSHYPKRIQEFMADPLENNDVVFLGNSITEQGGDWGVRFDNPKVKNRGIAGDTTDGVLARLDELIYFQPSQVFILIGINDLFREEMTPQKVHSNILTIVNRIHDKTPQTVIFVQTILPTTTGHLKSKIQLTNTMLKLSEATEPFELINLHDEFALDDDTMNMDYSTDGVHLNEKGYQVWVSRIFNLVGEE